MGKEGARGPPRSLHQRGLRAAGAWSRTHGRARLEATEIPCVAALRTRKESETEEPEAASPQHLELRSKFPNLAVLLLPADARRYLWFMERLKNSLGARNVGNECHPVFAIPPFFTFSLAPIVWISLKHICKGSIWFWFEDMKRQESINSLGNLLQLFHIYPLL